MQLMTMGLLVLSQQEMMASAVLLLLEALTEQLQLALQTTLIQ